jgi:hypothetical protein
VTFRMVSGFVSVRNRGIFGKFSLSVSPPFCWISPFFGALFAMTAVESWFLGCVPTSEIDRPRPVYSHWSWRQVDSPVLWLTDPEFGFVFIGALTTDRRSPP